MTKEEVIDKIIWVLEQLDVLRGSCGTAGRKELEIRSHQLRQQRKALVRKVFNENDAGYQAAAAEISQANAALQDTIEDINRLAQTIDSLSQFTTAIDKLMISVVRPMA